MTIDRARICHMTFDLITCPVGVTGVKKVIFTKNATPPTDYRVWSRDSCICISLYKSYRIKKSYGVIWGHRGQKIIFTKNAISSSMLHSMPIRLIQVDKPRDPLPMLWGQMSIWGHLGSLGSKGHFH